MIEKIIPLLWKIVGDQPGYPKDYFYKERTEKLSFLQTEFGWIGNWAQEGGMKLAEEETTRRCEAEKRRQSAEAGRRLLDEWRLSVKVKRESEKRCVMCGDSLTIIDKLLMRKKHSGCTIFLSRSPDEWSPDDRNHKHMQNAKK